MSRAKSEQELRDDIKRLENELKSAKACLSQQGSVLEKDSTQSAASSQLDINRGKRTLLKHCSRLLLTCDCPDSLLSSTSSLHELLLLTDSALPLGSFAFSSGLESYLAHHTSSPRQSHSKLLPAFLSNSLASVARLSLPYLFAAHAEPSNLPSLDNDFDASTPCIVACRASIAQGRALLTIWERAFRSSTANGLSAQHVTASEALRSFSEVLKIASFSSPESAVDVDPFGPRAHLAPLFGVVSRALSISAPMAAYAFLLNHAKAVLSAAVRSNVIGPYQAQGYLSSSWMKGEIERLVDRAKGVRIEDAGQVWVAGDVWVGRHELLYSRIFNA